MFNQLIICMFDARTAVLQIILYLSKINILFLFRWLKGPEDVQATDVHYRSLTGLN